MWRRITEMTWIKQKTNNNEMFKEGNEGRLKNNDEYYNEKKYKANWTYSAKTQ